KALEEAEQRLAQSAILLAQAAWQNNDVRGAREWLDPGPTEPDPPPGWGGHYLRRPFAGGPLTPFRHRDGGGPGAFRPDGARPLAAASWGRTARVWAARSGAPLLDLKGHTGLVFGVSFSPDGSRLATTSTDQTARVWDARGGAAVLVLKGHTREVTGVSFS